MPSYCRNICLALIVVAVVWYGWFWPIAMQNPRVPITHPAARIMDLVLTAVVIALARQIFTFGPTRADRLHTWLWVAAGGGFFYFGFMRPVIHLGLLHFGV